MITGGYSLKSAVIHIPGIFVLSLLPYLTQPRKLLRAPICSTVGLVDSVFLHPRHYGRARSRRWASSRLLRSPLVCTYPTASQRAKFYLSRTSRIAISENTIFCRYCPAYVWLLASDIKIYCITYISSSGPAQLSRHIPAALPAYLSNRFLDILDFKVIQYDRRDSETKTQRVRCPVCLWNCVHQILCVAVLG